MNAVTFGTPYYVLREQNRPIRPKVVPLHSGIECSAIYGFSGKSRYDRFCMKSQDLLVPYPLVKVYLRGQIGVPDDGLKLIVIDASEPREPDLYAATPEAVLEAHENGATHVTATFCLIFDEEVNAYRVKHEGND